MWALRKMEIGQIFLLMFPLTKAIITILTVSSQTSTIKNRYILHNYNNNNFVLIKQCMHSLLS